MCTQHTVNYVYAHNTKLMLYVHTADSQCCVCTQLTVTYTQQTVKAVCAHNRYLRTRSRQSMFYVHPRESQCCMCTEHTVNAVCTHNRLTLTVDKGFIILFAMRQEK